MPIIGVLGATSALGFAAEMAAFRQGLQASGYREGQNVTIEYRWANNEYDRLPALAADLVGRQVTVISAIGGNSPSLSSEGSDPDDSDRILRGCRSGSTWSRSEPQPTWRKRHRCGGRER